MKHLKLVTFVIVILFMGIITVSAEEKFGVKIYEGAKYDVTTSDIISKSMSINASCYRTNDDVIKVIEFFKGQAGLEFMGGSQESAMFRKDDVDITIQNPWMDMQSGGMNKDTLITVVKHE